MPNVNFDDDNQNDYRNNGDDNEGITGWLQDTFNLGRGAARKILIGFGAIAFLVSLYFWFQLLL